MRLTLSPGMRNRLSIRYVVRRAGGWARRWGKQTHPYSTRAWDDGKDPPGAGVREPATPPLLDHDGSVALPHPGLDEFR